MEDGGLCGMGNCAAVSGRAQGVGLELRPGYTVGLGEVKQGGGVNGLMG